MVTRMIDPTYQLEARTILVPTIVCNGLTSHSEMLVVNVGVAGSENFLITN